MADPAVDTQLIKERLAFLKGGRFKAWTEICAHCGFCSDSCFFYLAHDKDPKYMPAYKIMHTLEKLSWRQWPTLPGEIAPHVAGVPFTVRLESILV
jgi:hypothetical protein